MRFTRQAFLGPCKVCRSIKYGKTSDGNYICEFGHIHDDFVDEADDDWDGAGGGGASKSQTRVLRKGIYSANLMSQSSQHVISTSSQPLMSDCDAGGDDLVGSDFWNQLQGWKSFSFNGNQYRRAFWERIIYIQSLLILQSRFMKEYLEVPDSCIDGVWSLWRCCVLALREEFEARIQRKYVSFYGQGDANDHDDENEDEDWDEFNDAEGDDDNSNDDSSDSDGESSSDRDSSTDGDSSIDGDSSQGKVRKKHKVGVTQIPEKFLKSKYRFPINSKISIFICYLALQSNAYQLMLADLIYLVQIRKFPFGPHLKAVTGIGTMSYWKISPTRLGWFNPLSGLINAIDRGQRISQSASSQLPRFKEFMTRNFMDNVPVTFLITRVLAHFHLPITLYPLVKDIFESTGMIGTMNLGENSYPEMKITSLVIVIISALYRLDIPTSSCEQKERSQRILEKFGLQCNYKKWLQSLSTDTLPMDFPPSYNPGQIFLNPERFLAALEEYFQLEKSSQSIKLPNLEIPLTLDNDDDDGDVGDKRSAMDAQDDKDLESPVFTILHYLSTDYLKPFDANDSCNIHPCAEILYRHAASFLLAPPSIVANAVFFTQNQIIAKCKKMKGKRKAMARQ